MLGNLPCLAVLFLAVERSPSLGVVAGDSSPGPNDNNGIAGLFAVDFTHDGDAGAPDVVDGSDGVGNGAGSGAVGDIGAGSVAVVVEGNAIWGDSGSDTTDIVGVSISSCGG